MAQQVWATGGRTSLEGFGALGGEGGGEGAIV